MGANSIGKIVNLWMRESFERFARLPMEKGFASAIMICYVAFATTLQIGLRNNAAKKSTGFKGIEFNPFEAGAVGILLVSCFLILSKHIQKC